MTWNRDSLFEVVDLLPSRDALRLRRTSSLVRDAVEMQLAMRNLEYLADSLVSKAKPNHSMLLQDPRLRMTQSFLEAPSEATAHFLASRCLPDVLQRCIERAHPVGWRAYRRGDDASHDMLLGLRFDVGLRQRAVALADAFNANAGNVEVHVSRTDPTTMLFAVRGGEAARDNEDAAATQSLPMLRVVTQRLGTLSVVLADPAQGVGGGALPDWWNTMLVRTLEARLNLRDESPFLIVVPLNRRGAIEHKYADLLRLGGFGAVGVPHQLWTKSFTAGTCVQCPDVSVTLDGPEFCAAWGADEVDLSQSRITKVSVLFGYATHSAMVHVVNPSVVRLPLHVDRLRFASASHSVAKFLDFEHSPVPNIVVAKECWSNNKIQPEQLRLPDGLLSLGRHAFAIGEGLQSIDLRHCCKLHHVGRAVFSCQQQLQSTLFGPSPRLHRVGSHFLASSRSLTAVDLSPLVGLQHLGSYAFQYCGELQAVTLPDALTTIGDGVFDGCRSLRRLDLSNCGRLESVGFVFCRGAKALHEVAFPASLRRLGDKCFDGCTTLRTVPLVHTALEELPKHGFRHCSALGELVLPGTLRVVHRNICADTKALRLVDCSRSAVLYLDPLSLVSLLETTFYCPPHTTGVDSVRYRSWHQHQPTKLAFDAERGSLCANL